MRSAVLLLLFLVIPMPVQGQRIIRRPMDSVDVEVVYVKYYTDDPKDLEKRFQGALAKAMGGIQVEEKEWWQRWRYNHEAYRWMGGTSQDVKRQVKREVQVAKLLHGLMEKIGPKTDLKVLAEKHGLTFASMKKVTRSTIQNHPDVGSPRAAMMVWASGVDKLASGSFQIGNVVPYQTKTKNIYWPDIFDEPANFMALFRIVKHHPLSKAKKR